ARMMEETFSQHGLDILSHNPEARLHLEALLIDHEASLHLLVGGRACQIAKLRMRAHPRPFYRPTRPRPLLELLARLSDLARDCLRIEHLAQARAAKLLRERDADPLSPYAPASLRSSRQTPGSRADIEACSALQLQGCSRSATLPGSRSSSGRAGVAGSCSVTSARGPPLTPTIPDFVIPRLAGFPCEVAGVRVF
ncbi:MAG: hypothetical protein R3C46_16520, partial [Hyphomonadaceae bacterium]